MRTSVNVLFCIIVLALTACGGGSFEKRLSALDSVLKDKPDSVYQLLLGMEKEAIMQKKSNRMYYELMRADAQNKAYVDFTTDSVMRIVADYYDRHGSANEQMRAHYLLGCTYRDLKDVPMELQCFQDAVEKADTTKKDCDLYTLYAIYGQMADIYHEQYLPEEELNTLAMCERIAHLDNDTVSAAKSYELRMRAYYFMNMSDSVLSVTKNAHRRYKTLGLDQMAAMMLSPAIDILIKRGQYEEAEEYIKEVDLYLGEKSKSPIQEKGKIVFAYHKGCLALHHDQIDLADYNFRLLLTDQKEYAYSGLLSLFEKTGNTDSITKYARLYTGANDLDRLNDNTQTIAQITSMYNYGRQEKIAKEKTIAHKKAKETLMWLYIILVSVLSVIAVTAIIIYNRNKAKDRQYQLLFKRFCDAKALVEELETKKEGMEKVGNREEAEKLDILQHELDASKMEIEQLSLKLNRTKQPNEAFDFDAWLMDFKKHDSVEKLWAIISKPKANSQIPDSLLYDLQKHFKTECHNYMQMLSSHLYDLNDLDRKVVMLDICGFSTKDIANILGKTPQQISNTHNRIKNKLFPSIESTYLLKKSLLAMLCDSLR